MADAANKKPDAGTGGGPKYFVVIEGKEYEWTKPTITTEEIAALGGWPATDGVTEINQDNDERSLNPGEIITLKPGHGFGKKLKWRRG